MIKKIIYLFSFLIFTFITGCSFDDKTGIWAGSEKEKKRISEIEKKQKKIIDTVKLYSSENLYTKELHTIKNIVLSEPKKTFNPLFLRYLNKFLFKLLFGIAKIISLIVFTDLILSYIKSIILLFPIFNKTLKGNLF